ncbi:MAG: hypothetical protein CMM58_11685 [Rhodospirillaceae bacterium]|nr:hypothetical protein [Rhodospirillaceae bacterium]|tara:strand:+ start:997 stop:1716 length:720 start_codon:yes stop_codon:yes gene_type:complete
MVMLITRAQEDSELVALALDSMGIESLISPVITIVRTGLTIPLVSDFQAVVITSKHAVDVIRDVNPDRSPPIYCVGDRTAELVASAGFLHVYSAAGNNEDLSILLNSQLVPEAGKILYLCGKDTSGRLENGLEKNGFEIERKIAYEAKAKQSLNRAAADAFRDNRISGVFLFSPRSAIILVELLKREELDRFVHKIDAYCLSDAVACEAQRLDWNTVSVAERPAQSELLALVRQNLKIV